MVDPAVVLVSIVRKDGGGVRDVEQVHVAGHIQRPNLIGIEVRTVAAILGAR
jgi:hypothetical protein